MSKTPLLTLIETQYISHTFESNNSNTDYNTIWGILPSGLICSHGRICAKITDLKTSKFEDGTHYTKFKTINNNELIITEDRDQFNKSVKENTPLYITGRGSIPLSQSSNSTTRLYLTKYNTITIKNYRKQLNATIDSSLTRIENHVTWRKNQKEKLKINKSNITKNSNKHNAAFNCYPESTLKDLLADLKLKLININTDLNQ